MAPDGALVFAGFQLRSALSRSLGRIARSTLVLLAFGALFSPTRAQTTSLARKPMFRPGLYETESRDNHLSGSGYQEQNLHRLGRSRRLPARHDRALSHTAAIQKRLYIERGKPLPDGFAFAMDCGDAKAIISFHVATDVVQSTVQTRVASRPAYSSTILTLSRRIGACAHQTPGKAP